MVVRKTDIQKKRFINLMNRKSANREFHEMPQNVKFTACKTSIWCFVAKIGNEHCCTVWNSKTVKPRFILHFQDLRSLTFWVFAIFDDNLRIVISSCKSVFAHSWKPLCKFGSNILLRWSLSKSYLRVHFPRVSSFYSAGHWQNTNLERYLSFQIHPPAMILAP